MDINIILHLYPGPLFVLLLCIVFIQYHKEHQYPICSYILKHITCVKPSPRTSGNVMKMISLWTKNSGTSLMWKWWLLYISHFMYFYVWWFTGMQPLYNKRHLYIFHLCHSFYITHPPWFDIIVLDETAHIPYKHSSLLFTCSLSHEIWHALTLNYNWVFNMYKELEVKAVQIVDK